jgi:hypothetical protein
MHDGVIIGSPLAYIIGFRAGLIRVVKLAINPARIFQDRTGFLFEAVQNFSVM